MGKRGTTYYTSNKFLNGGKRVDISVNPLYNNVLCDSVRLINFTTTDSRGNEQISYLLDAVVCFEDRNKIICSFYLRIIMNIDFYIKLI